MKGLLIKDLRLWMLQKNTLFVLLMVGLFLTVSSRDITSGTSYLCILAPLFTITTLSYDEFDNGMPFLMTMPVSRRIYVREKYVFGLLSTLFIWMIATALTLIVTARRQFDIFFTDILSSALGTAIAAILMLSIFLPFIIKFGSEKYRFVLLAMAGIVFLLSFAAKQAAAFFQIDLHMFLDVIRQVPEHVIIAALTALCLAFLGISYAVSVKIMEKKEF